MGEPIVLVLFGVTGDLARRKLLPALVQIEASGVLENELKIIGITRREVDVDELIGNSLGALASASQALDLRKKLNIFQMNPADLADYQKLKKELNKVAPKHTQRLFYISVPPQISQPIIANLGESGLAKPPTKLLLEKPFGTDLGSAEELVENLRKWFDEDQMYRIDHFLAKEMAQNILIFRERNGLFRSAWNNQAIESVTVMAAEEIGIEGRAEFYEQTGALRDVLQNHLMQLLAVTIMDLPKTLTDKAIQQARVDALKSLKPADPALSLRGQYVGYEDEVGNFGSTVETLAKVVLESSHPAWKGVPFTLITGKALKEKVTEIQIRFKANGNSEANLLRLRIQPQEGVVLDLWAKHPGYDRTVEQVSMSFDYNPSSTGQALPDAYEQVLVDAMRSNKTLFASSPEILEAWRVLEPVQESWAMGHQELLKYQRGTDVGTLLN